MVVVMMVMRRSGAFSMVREAMMAGTPQPEPISIGMKDFPDSPNLRKARSRMKAIRAIYPQASRNARKIKKTTICGTKPRTAPTPEMIPSTTRPSSHSATPQEAMSSWAPGMTHSPKRYH